MSIPPRVPVPKTSPPRPGLNTDAGSVATSEMLCMIWSSDQLAGNSLFFGNPVPARWPPPKLPFGRTSPSRMCEVLASLARLTSPLSDSAAEREATGRSPSRLSRVRSRSPSALPAARLVAGARDVRACWRSTSYTSLATVVAVSARPAPSSACKAWAEAVPATPTHIARITRRKRRARRGIAVTGYLILKSVKPAGQSTVYLSPVASRYAARTSAQLDRWLRTSWAAAKVRVG